MRILIAGSSGFIGQALIRELSKSRHEILCLVRRPPNNQNEIQWNPSTGELEASSIEGFNAVIHLGGAGVADKIWTSKYKETLLKSRTESTRTLCRAISECKNKPELFICSSGVNYYGAKSEQKLTENSPNGKSFLAHVCKEWEAASESLEALGIRRVLMRTGVVLGPGGGMLAKCLPAFKMGLGGNIGMGKRYFPWISLCDMVKLISHCLNDDSLHGPVNACAPEIISNATFTKTLARHLGRPSIFPVPTLVFKLLPKEMADDLFLCDLQIHPKKIQASSFEFTHPTIKTLLEPKK